LTKTSSKAFTVFANFYSENMHTFVSNMNEPHKEVVDTALQRHAVKVKSTTEAGRFGSRSEHRN